MTLGAIGNYSGTVTATNASGTSPSFNFDYSVTDVPFAKPQITSVTPTGQVGITNSPLQFSATALNAPTSWNWNFGTGATPSTSTDAAPIVTLSTTAGNYTGSVTATNALGTSPSFTFHYDVTHEVAPGWRFTRVDTGSTNAMKMGCIAMIGGKPAIFYAKNYSASHFVAQALTETPLLPSDWTIYQYEADLGSDVSEKVVTYLGRPAIVFSSAGSIVVMYGNSATPASASDWTRCTAKGTAQYNRNPSIGIVNNRMAVVMRPDSASGNIWYGYATEAWPTNSSQWVSARVASTSSLNEPNDVMEIDGKPAVFYTTNVLGPSTQRYMVNIGRCLVAEPDATSDWAPYQLDGFPNNNSGQRVARFITLNGLPAVIYDTKVADTGTGLNELKLAVATSTSPTGAGSWVKHSPFPASAYDNLDAPPAYDSSGIPAIALPPDVWIGRGLSAQPTTINDWDYVRFFPTDVDTATHVGLQFMADDRLTMGYITKTSNERELWFGQTVTPW